MNAIQTMIFVVVILCLSWTTVKAGHCYDVKGRAIPLGSVYYDGNSWKTCGNNNKIDQRQTMALLEEKWKTIFKLYDFNHDGLVTTDDFEIYKNNHIKAFELHGTKAAFARSMLDEFWNCIMMFSYGSGQETTEEKFLTNYKQAYKTHNAIEKMKDCYYYLLPETDVNRDGFVSYDELFKLYRAWNEGREPLVRSLFNMMGPNAEDLVPYEHFEAFYGETIFGENKNFFDIVMDHYRAKVDPI